MTTRRLVFLPIASLLACSGSSLRVPPDARSTDQAVPSIDASDSRGSTDGESPALVDGGLDTSHATTPDARPAVDLTVKAAPADARPDGAPDVKEVATLPDASQRDATRDIAIPEGKEAGVDGDPGLPACTQPTTSATITIEVPSGNITVGTSYGSSPNDVWVTTLPDHKVARWNGSAWTWVTELADVPILTIAGSGPADVWLGGTGGVLWHWDGTALSLANSKTSLDIQQIAVLASGQAFALAFVPVHDGTFDLLRLVGSEWSVVGQPSAPLDMYFLPHELYAPTANEAWVVAYDEQVFHYQNDALTPVAVPEAWTVWGTAPDNVWFGEYKWDGETIVQPLDRGSNNIWGTGPTDMWIGSTHWDGQTATDYRDTALSWTQAAIRGLSATDVWAITGTAIVHLDESLTWTEVITHPDTTSIGAKGLATGIWQVGTDALWITGRYNQIYLYQVGAGGGLTPIPQTGVPPTDDLLGVWGSSTQDLWAVGENGAILHGDGSAWTRVASPTTSTLRAVSGSTAQDVWAVGDAGTVLHWNGVAWTSVAASTSARLYGVWATVGYVVAVGADGTIIADDGRGFAAQPSGTTEALLGVWGRTPADVYAADSKNLYRYDGAVWTSKTIIVSGSCVVGVWGTSDGVFANGYYDDGSHAQRLVPAYGPASISSPFCLALYGVWAGSATDFWGVGGELHTINRYDTRKNVYRFNGECMDTVASNLFSSSYDSVTPPAPAMRAIFGVGEHDLWAVGELGMIAHIRR